MIRTPHAHQMNGHKSPLLKSYHQRSASSRKLSRQFGKGKSLRRFLVAVFVLAVVLSGLRHYHIRSDDGLVVNARAVVLGNCASIEALRHADECFEAFDFVKSKKQPPKRHLRKQSLHLEHEESIPWISSYGLVLDYDAAYDGLSQDSGEQLYTTKRTLKCLTGFHMSIVWDIEFSTPLLQAYQAGDFGLRPNSSNEIATSCPDPSSQSSASMSIKINCGMDIQRDAWGHPATEADHSEMETCLRMSWSWVKGRVGDQDVAPWAGLCHEGQYGTYECDREVFHLEGADD